MHGKRASEMDDQITVLAHAPGQYLVARWRNVSVVYWMRQGTVQAVAHIRSVLEPLYEQTGPCSASTIHLIRDGAGLPEPEVRAAVLAMSSHFAPQTACLGIVLMGAGFWASALQSVLTALRMLAPRRSAMMRFSREPSDLCEWFPAEHTQRTGTFVDRVGLASAVERICSLAASPPVDASIH